MPSTLHRCVLPGSESDGSIGVKRAMRQTIFEAPTSSTERIALLRAGICRMRGGSARRFMVGRPSSARAHLPTRPRLLATDGRTCGPRAEIERKNVTFENARLALDP